MKKSTVFILISCVVTLINLVLLFFIFFKNPHHKPHSKPREIIIKKLNFDEEQIAKYDLLR